MYIDRTADTNFDLVNSAGLTWVTDHWEGASGSYLQTDHDISPKSIVSILITGTVSSACTLKFEIYDKNITLVNSRTIEIGAAGPFGLDNLASFFWKDGNYLGKMIFTSVIAPVDLTIDGIYLNTTETNVLSNGADTVITVGGAGRASEVGVPIRPLKLRASRGGAPAVGVPVYFTVPLTGPTIVIAGGNTQVTDSNGECEFTGTPIGGVGAYAVIATVPPQISDEISTRYGWRLSGTVETSQLAILSVNDWPGPSSWSVLGPPFDAPPWDTGILSFPDPLLPGGYTYGFATSTSSNVPSAIIPPSRWSETFFSFNPVSAVAVPGNVATIDNITVGVGGASVWVRPDNVTTNPVVDFQIDVGAGLNIGGLVYYRYVYYGSNTDALGGKVIVHTSAGIDEQYFVNPTAGQEYLYIIIKALGGAMEIDAIDDGAGGDWDITLPTAPTDKTWIFHDAGGGTADLVYDSTGGLFTGKVTRLSDSTIRFSPVNNISFSLAVVTDPVVLIVSLDYSDGGTPLTDKGQVAICSTPPVVTLLDLSVPIHRYVTDPLAYAAG